MTNAEAILRLEDHFMVHNDGRPTPFLDEAVNKAYKALEIASRLETINIKNRINHMLCDGCGCPSRDCQNTCINRARILYGYELALSDIRGDNNG